MSEADDRIEKARADLDAELAKRVKAMNYNPFDDHPQLAMDLVFDELAALRVEIAVLFDHLTGKLK